MNSRVVGVVLNQKREADYDNHQHHGESWCAFSLCAVQLSGRTSFLCVFSPPVLCHERCNNSTSWPKSKLAEVETIQGQA